MGSGGDGEDPLEASKRRPHNGNVRLGWNAGSRARLEVAKDSKQ
jgi:hypothetical protein